MERLKPWIWGVLVAGLAAALSWRAWGAHLGALDLQRRTVEADTRLDALTTEKRRLQAEIDALKNDPIYLEKLLRQDKMVGAGEE
jgi:cell division protein FtsB